MKPNLEQRITIRKRAHAHRNNELHQYSRIMDNLIEIGFFYKEAMAYALPLVKRRYK